MPEHRGWYSRGYLPHRDEPGLVQAITFRLADSLPLEEVRRVLSSAEQGSARRARMQALLDEGGGGCLLSDPRVAALVENVLLSRDGLDYSLLAWVIMPNHVHVLIETLEGITLDRMLHGWKGYSARRVNDLLGRHGSLWHREYYDRYIRDAEHLEAAVLYVHNNPVRARLVETPQDWRFGSASRVAAADALWHPLRVPL